MFFSRPGNDKSFNACRDQLGISAKTALKLTDLSDTRWVCRWRNVNATKQSLNILISCLRQLSSPEQFEQVSSRGQWFVKPNAATRVHCLLGCAGQSSVASASCSCLAAEKTMTLAQASRTVASTVASLEKIRSSDNE
jgi:hypothetical protein